MQTATPSDKNLIALHDGTAEANEHRNGEGNSRTSPTFGHHYKSVETSSQIWQAV